MAERHKLYDINYSTERIRLRNKLCPKCGRVMAFHKKPKPRWHCGHCGYVEYVEEGK